MKRRYRWDWATGEAVEVFRIYREPWLEPGFWRSGIQDPSWYEYQAIEEEYCFDGIRASNFLAFLWDRIKI